MSVELHMVPIREALYFPKVKELFDSKGAILDKDYAKRAKNFFGELEMYAKNLKPLRQPQK